MKRIADDARGLRTLWRDLRDHDEPIPLSRLSEWKAGARGELADENFYGLHHAWVRICARRGEDPMPVLVDLHESTREPRRPRERKRRPHPPVLFAEPMLLENFIGVATAERIERGQWPTLATAPGRSMWKRLQAQLSSGAVLGCTFKQFVRLQGLQPAPVVQAKPIRVAASVRILVWFPDPPIHPDERPRAD